MHARLAANALRAYAPYASKEAHKLLTDNRERYIAQSAATRDGEVAPLPPARSLTALPSRQGVGSSSRDDAEWCAFVAATSGAIR